MGIPSQRRPVVILSCVILLLGVSRAQTFDVNGSPQSPQPESGSGFGWGSSIDVARKARAAEDALKRGEYAIAANYADQAAKSAPHNPDLWFLLGYSSRLAGHYQ